MKRIFIVVLVFVLSFVLSVSTSGNSDDFQAKDFLGIHDGKILSRKKRFLVFPEGSSLQLIFDWVVPMVGMPNILTIGITAALAWQLPHDPTAPFRRPAEVIHRRVDTPNNTKTTTKSRYEATSPSPYKYQKNYHDLLHYKYPQKYHVNSRFKPPYYGMAFRNGLRRKHFYVQKGQPWNELRPPRVDYAGLVYDQVHRTTRRDLYAKLGKLLASKQLDAKGCLFRVICQVNKVPEDERGTFWQEILRAIFKVRTSPIDQEDEFDEAAQEVRDCSEIYPSCDLFK